MKIHLGNDMKPYTSDDEAAARHWIHWAVMAGMCHAVGGHKIEDKWPGVIQNPEVDVKLLVDGQELDIAYVFQRMCETFEEEVSKEAANLVPARMAKVMAKIDEAAEKFVDSLAFDDAPKPAQTADGVDIDTGMTVYVLKMTATAPFRYEPTPMVVGKIDKPRTFSYPEKDEDGMTGCRIASCYVDETKAALAAASLNEDASTSHPPTASQSG